MLDLELGRVADRPAGGVEAKAEVDVLAEAQVLAEAADREQGGAAGDDRGGGDVGDPPARSAAARVGTHVEGERPRS